MLRNPGLMTRIKQRETIKTDENYELVPAKNLNNRSMRWATYTCIHMNTFEPRVFDTEHTVSKRWRQHDKAIV